MCGIVGFIGNQSAQKVLLDGLECLEYRGYDSAGIAILDENNKMQVKKSKGRLAQLRELVKDNPLQGNMGIGHTRWATHGEPSDLNAHPHTDVKGDIAIVHNGIIENFDSLRKHLIEKGCKFVSQTDTEVIAHLLNDIYEGDMFAALRKAFTYLEGSYAIAVICINEPDKIFCIRKGCPLVLGVSAEASYLASDIPPLLPYTRDMIFMNDKEIAVLQKGSITLFDKYGNELEPEIKHIDWDTKAAEKGGYKHYMLKEMHEQPTVLRDTMYAFTQGTEIKLKNDVSRITLTACGTAYHAGIAGSYFIETLAQLPTRVEIASELRYRNPFYLENEMLLAISQSGETADTLAALRNAKERGLQVMSLCNTIGSTISRETGDNSMFTHAGPEIAVASTKAYVTQVEALLLLSLDLAQKRGKISEQRVNEVKNALNDLPQKAQTVLDDAKRVKRYSALHQDKDFMFFIGRGIDYALAMEAALKVKEISYIKSEAYAAGELKHGAIALIEEGTPVVAICTQRAMLPKTISNLIETKARGASTLLVCPQSFYEDAKGGADEIWTIPDSDDLVTPILAIMPMQLLAYHCAIMRGRDVDKPRNLAKSVTVE